MISALAARLDILNHFSDTMNAIDFSDVPYFHRVNPAVSRFNPMYPAEGFTDIVISVPYPNALQVDPTQLYNERYALAGMQIAMNTDTKELELRYIGVVPSRRQQGYAKMLMVAFVQWYQTTHPNTVLLRSRPGLNTPPEFTQWMDRIFTNAQIPFHFN